MRTWFLTFILSCLLLSACSRKPEPEAHVHTVAETSDEVQIQVQVPTAPVAAKHFQMDIYGLDGKIAATYHIDGDVTYDPSFNGNYHFENIANGKTVWISNKFEYILSEED
jgi:hypothetical protein